ncbi:MAG: hypothetical protein WD846_03180 [Patescibacteria group bacterium]
MAIIIISYLLYALVLAGFAVAAIYHARRFGFPGDRTALATGTYLTVVVLIIATTVIAIGGAGIGGSL